MRIIRFGAFLILAVVFLTWLQPQVGCYELERGESLAYSAKFLWVIPVGDATMGVRDVVGFSGEKVYLVTCEAKTPKWFLFLFKAEVVLNSYIGARNLYPYKFEQILKIAGKPDDVRRATYDRVNNVMDAEGKGKKKVPADVRDPLSAIYFLRTQKFKDGIEIKQTVNNNQSNYIFDSKVAGKKRIGKFNCWVLDSKIRRENKSMYHSMDAVIYISDDARRLPVFIQARTQLGPVTLSLKDIGKDKE